MQFGCCVRAPIRVCMASRVLSRAAMAGGSSNFSYSDFPQYPPNKSFYADSPRTGGLARSINQHPASKKGSWIWKKKTSELGASDHDISLGIVGQNLHLPGRLIQRAVASAKMSKISCRKAPSAKNVAMIAHLDDLLAQVKQGEEEIDEMLELLDKGEKRERELLEKEILDIERHRLEVEVEAERAREMDARNSAF